MTINFLSFSVTFSPKTDNAVFTVTITSISTAAAKNSLVSAEIIGVKNSPTFVYKYVIPLNFQFVNSNFKFY